MFHSGLHPRRGLHIVRWRGVVEFSLRWFLSCRWVELFMAAPCVLLLPSRPNNPLQPIAARPRRRLNGSVERPLFKKSHPLAVTASGPKADDQQPDTVVSPRAVSAGIFHLAGIARSLAAPPPPPLPVSTELQSTLAGVSFTERCKHRMATFLAQQHRCADYVPRRSCAM